MDAVEAARIRKRRRRGLGAVIVGILVVLALVTVYLIADTRARSYAEDRVRQEIAANLPASVSGTVNVSIGGFSVIGQYLSGSFDRVTLSAPALSVNGVPASVLIVATDVPVDQSKQVGDVRGTVDLDQAALNALVHASAGAGSGVQPDASLTLGDGTVSYAGTLTVLGVALGYQATAVPSAAADSILLTPKDATVTTGAGSVDANGLLTGILGRQPVRVCVAGYLPAGVDLAGVTVTPDRARITLQSSTLTLSRSALTTLGRCA